MIWRFVCRVFGHAWRLDRRGEPVVSPFAVCVRCGKWARL